MAQINQAKIFMGAQVPMLPTPLVGSIGAPIFGMCMGVCIMLTIDIILRTCEACFYYV